MKRSGIDKIKVILNPCLINKSNQRIHTLISQDIKNNVLHVDSHNKLILHKSGPFLSLAVHEEWFNPYYDMKMNIATAIFELIKKGFLYRTPFDVLMKICLFSLFTSI
jgi:hypothetical protein